MDGDGSVTQDRSKADMFRYSLPFLLRGIGTTIVLIGTMIALVTAQRHQKQSASSHQKGPEQIGETNAPASLELLAREMHSLKVEVETESIAEEVVENKWFEWLGILGGAVISSSFYTEAILRRLQREA